MSSLLTLPPEVLQHSLFPLLEWNDLLRLRRVSIAAKVLVHDYVKVNPHLAPEIEIGDKGTERNVRAFMDLDLPSAKIYLRNNRTGSGFYQENLEELSRYVEVNGSVVTHLRVDHFSLYCSGMERQFLEGLLNLQSFEADWFDTYVDVDKDMMLSVPRVFGHVTVLKLKHHGDGRSHYRLVDDGVNGVIKLLTACRSLEHFRHLSILNTRESSTKLIRFLDAAIRQREDNPEVATLSKLKVIDFDFAYLGFDNISEEENRAENPFAQFLRTCAVHGILLQGVRAGKCLENFARNRGDLLMPIQSMALFSKEPYNWTWMMETEMPILEKVVLSTFLHEPESIRHDRVITRSANWPMLKSLELVVDNFGGRPAGLNDAEMRNLFRMLFEGISRTALTELKLWFFGEIGIDLLNVECLTTCCTNLKKLELINWGGNNEQFVKLWQGLTNLEEVILRNCARLGIDGLIGPDAQNPAFLNLKKLRKLTLYSLSGMPDIADNLFSSVIRHLNLTHFTISSADALEERCLKLLLGGQFEKSIQKFSFEFHGWSEIGATERENMRLQKLFSNRLT